MIKYKFGEEEFKIDFNDFLSITTNTIVNIKKYKSEFKDFSQLYEFIENNLFKISHILFDGYEYIIENGVLHNLYGPAIIRHNNNEQNKYAKVTTYRFFIEGKRIYDDSENSIIFGKGCDSFEKFKNNNIFNFTPLEKSELFSERYISIDLRNKFYNKTTITTNTGRNFILTPINLKEKILKDQRKKKLISIENNFFI